MRTNNEDVVLSEIQASPKAISFGRLGTLTRLNTAELRRCLFSLEEQNKVLIIEHDTVHDLHNLFIKPLNHVTP